MEREIEQQSSTRTYKKFLFDMNPKFFLRMGHFLKKPVSEFVPDEFIAAIYELFYKTPAFNSWVDHKDNFLFRAYVIETLKEVSSQNFWLLMDSRGLLFLGLNKIFHRNAEKLRGLKEHQEIDVRGNVHDDVFFKTLFEKLGGDFFEKNYQQRILTLLNANDNNSIVNLFEENPTRASEFMAQIIPFPHNFSQVLAFDHKSLKQLIGHRLWLFVPQAHKALVQLWLRNNKNEYYPSVLDHEEYREIIFISRIEKIELLFDLDLNLPDCYKEPTTSELMGVPFILNNGESYRRQTIMNEAAECYSQQKITTAPFSNKQICKVVTEPKNIPLVKNQLLVDIINCVVAFIELNLLYEGENLSHSDLINIIELFIQSPLTHELFAEPVVVLSGDLAGHTFEKAELLALLKAKHPDLDEKELIDKYNIVTNKAIKALVDYVHEQQLNEEPRLRF